jgi:hypothetical protein
MGCCKRFFAATQILKIFFMVKKLTGEQWKQIQFSGHKSLRNKYAVSSLGRAASYSSSLEEDGKLLRGSITSGYRTLNLHIEENNGTIYIHREVAKHFCRKNLRRINM